MLYYFEMWFTNALKLSKYYLYIIMNSKKIVYFKNGVVYYQITFL